MLSCHNQFLRSGVCGTKDLREAMDLFETDEDQRALRVDGRCGRTERGGILSLTY